LIDLGINLLQAVQVEGQIHNLIIGGPGRERK
jgi:hypothetical protein